MKTLLAFELGRLRNAEYYNFAYSVMDCFTNELKTEYKFTKRYNKLSDLMLLFEAIFNKNKKAKETPEVQAADKARDAVFIGIKQLVKGFLRSGDPGQKVAAEKIQFLLEPYKGANAAGYSSNSGSIHKFLADIKQPGIYDFVTMLNINYQVDELTTLNDAFDDIYHKRSESYLATHDADNLLEIRRKMNVAYRELVAKVDALYLIADDEDTELTKDKIGTLIDQINAIILQLSRTISRRSGINIIIKDENDKNEENKDNDSDGPIEISGELPHE